MLNSFSDVGLSPAQTEHLLQELTNHERKVCVSLRQLNNCVIMCPHTHMHGCVSLIDIKAFNNPCDECLLSNTLFLQEVLDSVRSVVAEGQGLIDSSQNVDDSVAVKCSELQKARENLIQELKDKKTMLTQARELHRKLEMVTRNTQTCTFTFIFDYIYINPSVTGPDI